MDGVRHVRLVARTSGPSRCSIGSRLRATPADQSSSARLMLQDPSTEHPQAWIHNVNKCHFGLARWLPPDPNLRLVSEFPSFPFGSPSSIPLFRQGSKEVRYRQDDVGISRAVQDVDDIDDIPMQIKLDIERIELERLLPLVEKVRRLLPVQHDPDCCSAFLQDETIDEVVRLIQLDGHGFPNHDQA